MQKIATRILLLLTVLFTFTSCEIVGGIFKAGMGVGIFIVIAIIGVLIFAFSKLFGGNK
ncbi:hypothetical protein [Flavobacterium agrisoli]|uniref:Phosphatidate cytidylyltransferase n=1 Tax=Flavobacterium agrisoli TaxID=2793066 RepID=A0A934PLB1_9FLAO|nr:hypothetical protein [Flavobacterium agrisoli]MBK0368929.1 hypothetical protein [Flavobacterium agrisoli]